MKIRKVIVLFVAVLALLIPNTLAFAQATTPPNDPISILLTIGQGFAKLAGFAGLTAVLINLLKQIPNPFKAGTTIITDTTSATWYAGMCLLELVFVSVCAFVKPEWSLGFLDVQAGAIAGILTVFGAYLVQLASGFATHSLLSNYKIPYLGYSFSQKAKADG